jgi:DNA gyrase subunit B
VPDRGIFGENTLDVGRVAKSLDEIAMLLPGIAVSFIDAREQPSVVQRFWHPDGLAAMVNALRRSHGRWPEEFDGILSDNDEVATFEGVGTKCEYRVAISWTHTAYTHVRSFANLSATLGGSHERGLRKALTRATNAVVEHQGDPWSDGECIRGLNAVVSVLVESPRYRGATKLWLENPEVEKFIAADLSRQLIDHLQSPGELRGWILNRLRMNR